jgi:hypothetical protein
MAAVMVQKLVRMGAAELPTAKREQAIKGAGE